MKLSKITTLFLFLMTTGTAAAGSNPTYDARIHDSLALGEKAKEHTLKTPCGGKFNDAQAYVAAQEDVAAHAATLFEIERESGISVDDALNEEAYVSVLRACGKSSRDLLNRKLQYCKDKPLFENAADGNGIER